MTPSQQNPSRFMQAALDSAQDGVLVECSGRVVYVNRAYAELLGYKRPAELLHRPVADFVSSADEERLARFAALRHAGHSAPVHYEFCGLCCDGSSVRLQASVSVTSDCGTAFIMTIVRPMAVRDSNGPAAGVHDTLSGREREVMQMLLTGKRPKEIAYALELSESTVSTHRARLMQKLGVCGARELYQYALRYNLIAWL
ncbi:MAG TPA: LuxR C-terminal-related transcriptional regulator [Thermoanaerobaculia bacterium]|jgi:PAS domain S-box-containing protein